MQQKICWGDRGDITAAFPGPQTQHCGKTENPPDFGPTLSGSWLGVGPGLGVGTLEPGSEAEGREGLDH